jgi:hypothetical protein
MDNKQIKYIAKPEEAVALTLINARMKEIVVHLGMIMILKKHINKHVNRQIHKALKKLILVNNIFL